jgi:hypothetical protein
MKKATTSIVTAIFLVVSSGCSAPPSGGYEAGQGPHGAKVDRMDAVTSGGGQRAVLSLHEKYASADSCKFGLTLTNNLPYKITNISFRFSAYTKGNVFYRHVTRNFFEVEPTDRQYREITFGQISCDKISYVEISDPGRCAMGSLTRFTSEPGDCIKHVYIAQSPYVRLTQK